MREADWIQAAIALIYAAILVVMILQLRKSDQQLRESREAAAESSRQTSAALDHARASVEATRDLARLHEALVAQAAASAAAANDAASAAREANAIAVAAYEADQRHRREARAAVATRVEGRLSSALDALLIEFAKLPEGRASEPAHVSLRYAQSAAESITSEDQCTLGAETTALLSKLLTDLRAAQESARGAGPRDPASVVPVVQTAAKRLHEFVGVLAKIARPGESPPEFETLRAAAWQKTVS